MSDTTRSLELYRSMRLIRRAEERLMEEYHPADEMRCPIHFCVGQEAAPAALGLALTAEDVIVSHYRSHGYYLAKGAPLDAMVAEFYGKATGANYGLAGSMELAHHDSKIFSGAIVGGPAGLAVGSAFAQKFQGSDAMTTAVFGDGAMDEGVSYEALNLAVLRQLPLLFLCENNHYAAHTAVATRTRAASPLARAQAFGIEGVQIADNDAMALADRMAEIVATVRKTSKPFFLEVRTYRFCGHVGPEGDDELGYRPPQEISEYLAADPLAALRARVLDGQAGAQELEILEARIEEQVDTAIAAAKQADFPDNDTAQAATVSGTYDPAVRTLIEGSVAEFEGAQSEAKLAPY
jgi:TPP-dependent pyruvate/acetoin dehydrogenase alpha subunit